MRPLNLLDRVVRPLPPVAALAMAVCLVMPGSAAAEPTIQTITTISCGGIVRVPDAEVQCLVRVKSSGVGATAATGVVKLTAAGGQIKPSCTLLALLGPESACVGTYVPKEGGLQTISAGYVGDQTHLPSNGQATVAVSTTATSLICRPPSFAAGGSTVCTAEVKNTGAPAAVPSGTVRFASSLEGQPEPSSCTLNESGSCSATFSATASGTYAIAATYGGDATHPGSRGETTVTARNVTETTIDCGPEVQFLGVEVKCFVRVRSSGLGATAATGFVTLTAGGKGVGGCLLAPSSGPPPDSTSECRYTPKEATLQKIIATYGGDKTHLSSSAKATVVVSHTVTSLTCRPESLAVGEASTCTAEVKNTGAAPNLSGTLSFKSDLEGRFEPSSCRVEESNVCTVKYFPEVGAGEEGGKHLITAAYEGDSAHPASQAEAALAVRGTSVKLACSQQSEALGDTAVCVARVVNEGIGPKSLTGTVQFSSSREGRFSSAVCTLTPLINGEGGFCSTSYTPELPGAHVIHAVYSGDSTHPPAIDGKSQVNAARRPTVTTFTCAASPPVKASTTCVARVRDSTATLGSAPTGEVVFSSPEQKDPFTDCFLTPVSFVESTCTTTYTREVIGSTLLIAQYRGGDKVHEPSETSRRLAHETATEVDCGSSTSPGVSNVCTVTVRDIMGGAATPPTEGGPTPPTGLVQFSASASEVGTFNRTSCSLVPIGPDASTCSGTPVTYRPPAEGTHVISAAYRSDSGSYEPSVGSKALEVRSG